MYIYINIHTHPLWVACDLIKNSNAKCSQVSRSVKAKDSNDKEISTFTNEDFMVRPSQMALDTCLHPDLH